MIEQFHFVATHEGWRAGIFRKQVHALPAAPRLKGWNGLRFRERLAIPVAHVARLLGFALEPTRHTLKTKDQESHQPQNRNEQDRQRPGNGALRVTLARDCKTDANQFRNIHGNSNQRGNYGISQALLRWKGAALKLAYHAGARMAGQHEGVELQHP